MVVPVLGAVLGLVAVLVALIAWVTTLLFTGRTKERSISGAAVRILITSVLGGAVLIGAYIGLPSLVGTTLPIMWLWAPDVALVSWILLGVVFLAAALVVAKEVAGCRRSRREISPVNAR
jgi:hypothetical protein